MLKKVLQGDNLEVMKRIDDESIHLIATDPPFNTGKKFTGNAGASFGDSWSWGDMSQHWVDGLRESKPALLCIIDGVRRMGDDSTAAYLAFMSVRLVEMRRVLRADGSIFLHCDPNASHYLKVLMDAIFGRKCFRNEIVWFYKLPSATKKYFPKKHDLIFWYTKSEKDWTFNADDVREAYAELSVKTYARGPVVFKSGHEAKQHPLGRLAFDVWEIPSLRTSKERIGYPTQKPLRLYERIIKAASKPGDVVLDPFCGSGTTLIAAEKLGRQWVGIDIHTEVENTVKSRLKHEGMPQLTS